MRGEKKEISKKVGIKVSKKENSNFFVWVRCMFLREIIFEYVV